MVAKRLLVILMAAKRPEDLLLFRPSKSRSFASLRMTK